MTDRWGSLLARSLAVDREADNLALTGVFFALKGRGDHIITTAVEHPAILDLLRFLARLGARVTVIPVDRTGMIDPEAADDAAMLASVAGSGQLSERNAALSAPFRVPPPILEDKHHAEPSAFMPENLLREARRQKGLPIANVPLVCVLDPDGDIMRELVRAGRAHRDPSWACYHTDLYVVRDGGSAYGIIGGAVGASFAVLVAEELFASGCGYLLSITSAGQIAPLRAPPYFILIDRALRDEGTSYHYLPPARYSEADPTLVGAAQRALASVDVAVVRGSTWTTDAPFRETATVIAARQAEGVLAVEMEAAALYAFATARRRPVLCVAHVTNQMGRTDGDFEKGEASGARDALRLIEAIVGLVDPPGPTDAGGAHP
ncbi:MAG TPA: aminotransferase class V-fold PLP-dependent enzyme [Candidatus Limnocylindrales bacterium]|jgi:uridine phosphorylase